MGFKTSQVNISVTQTNSNNPYLFLIREGFGFVVFISAIVVEDSRDWQTKNRVIRRSNKNGRPFILYVYVYTVLKPSPHSQTKIQTQSLNL